MFLVRSLLAVATLTLSTGDAFAVVVFATGDPGRGLTLGQPDPNVTVTGPVSGNPITVRPVDVVGTADDWARPLRGTQWVSPSAVGADAVEAPTGDYVYQFEFVLPFTPDPTRPSETDPDAVLRFAYFADNDVVGIDLSDGFDSVDIPAGSATQNRLGEAEARLVDLPFAIGPIGVGVTADVTAVNTDGAPFNPTGLDLLASVEIVRPVPEPSSLALLAIGALGLLGYGWQCRRLATR